MGQGQETHARHLLNQCMQDGGWLLLQNCHLGLEFLNELMDTITTKESVNEDFRTWITTEAHPEFPINLLQSSIKFTNEPPQGRNDFPSHGRDCCWSRKVGQKVMLVSVCSYLELPVLDITDLLRSVMSKTVPGNPLVWWASMHLLTPRIFPQFQDISSYSDVHLILSESLSPQLSSPE